MVSDKKLIERKLRPAVSRHFIETSDHNRRNRLKKQNEVRNIYLNVMGIHGQVHGTDKTQPQVVDGVDGLVAPDPHEAHLLHQLHPPDLDHVGDGDLGQPEVLGGSVTDVYPIRHVQVWSAMYHPVRFDSLVNFCKVCRREESIK